MLRTKEKKHFISIRYAMHCHDSATKTKDFEEATKGLYDQ
jgi:hypothetical protein